MPLAPRRALVRRAVEIAHRAVDERLVAGVHLLELRSDLVVDEVDSGHHALAVIAGAAVAQLERFAAAGRGPGRHLRRCRPRPSRGRSRLRRSDFLASREPPARRFLRIRNMESPPGCEPCKPVPSRAAPCLPTAGSRRRCPGGGVRRRRSQQRRLDAADLQHRRLDAAHLITVRLPPRVRRRRKKPGHVGEET